MNRFGSTRSMLLAVGLGSAVTAGTWYGASLKVQQDVNETIKTVSALTPELKIQQLQTSRERLVSQRTELQAKIDALSAKIAADAPTNAEDAQALSGETSTWEGSSSPAPPPETQSEERQLRQQQSRWWSFGSQK